MNRGRLKGVLGGRLVDAPPPVGRCRQPLRYEYVPFYSSYGILHDIIITSTRRLHLLPSQLKASI